MRQVTLPALLVLAALSTGGCDLLFPKPGNDDVVEANSDQSDRWWRDGMRGPDGVMVAIRRIGDDWVACYSDGTCMGGVRK